MREIPNLLLIGAAAKDAGKTTLACRIVERFRDRGIIAVKATIHRGNDAGQWSVVREESGRLDKDTGRLRAAGAADVLWLRSDENGVERAVAELLVRIPADAPIIGESNTLRRFVVPGLFLMVARAGEQAMKPTAEAVAHLADRHIHSALHKGALVFSPDIVPLLTFNHNRWSLTA